MMPEKKIPLVQMEGIDLGVYLLHFSGDMDIFDDTAAAYADIIATPHRHDHYCCFLLEEGSIDFYVDFKQQHVNKNTLLVSYPGQIHQTISSSNTKGWVLAFDAKMVDENARMVIEESLTKVALLTLSPADNEWFRKLFELINTVVGSKNPTAFHMRLIKSLLDSFIYQATVFYQQQEDKRMQEYSSRNVDITKRFRQLLQKNFKTIKKPSAYAEKMNISVSYLNDTVKAVTGFPLTYFIQQEIMTEAQRLLYYTEISIKEIAYSLGYEDDKYFIRLFGKMAGISPAAFRKQKTGG